MLISLLCSSMYKLFHRCGHMQIKHLLIKIIAWHFSKCSVWFSCWKLKPILFLIIYQQSLCSYSLYGHRVWKMLFYHLSARLFFWALTSWSLVVIVVARHSLETKLILFSRIDRGVPASIQVPQPPPAATPCWGFTSPDPTCRFRAFP